MSESKAEEIPANSQQCSYGRCAASAAGFAVFEADIDGKKNVLPFGWFCEEHDKRARAELTQAEWQKVREDFARRAGKPVPRHPLDAPACVSAALSTLREDEVELLLHYAGKSAVAKVADPVDVEIVPAGEMRDVFAPELAPWQRKKLMTSG